MPAIAGGGRGEHGHPARAGRRERVSRHRVRHPPRSDTVRPGRRGGNPETRNLTREFWFTLAEVPFSLGGELLYID